MDEELYTRNTGGPREGMHASNKAESSGTHSEKLRADSSRSQSMKGKYRNGKKSGEGGKKLKKSGEGKQGGKRFGFKPPIPTPPPPGTVNFTGNEHAEDNNAFLEKRRWFFFCAKKRATSRDIMRTHENYKKILLS